MEKPVFEREIWHFGNNIDCGGGAGVKVYSDRVEVEVSGGCWWGGMATVIVTKDKIIIEDMKGKRHELLAPWTKNNDS